MAKLLAAAGAELEFLDGSCVSALRAACANGDAALVESLRELSTSPMVD